VRAAGLTDRGSGPPGSRVACQRPSVGLDRQQIEEIVVDPIVVEQLTQEERQGATHRVSLGSELAKTNSEALNLVVVTDEFDADMFD
jgi:hypothetical protein